MGSVNCPLGTAAPPQARHCLHGFKVSPRRSPALAEGERSSEASSNSSSAPRFERLGVIKQTPVRGKRSKGRTTSGPRGQGVPENTAQTQELVSSRRREVGFECKGGAEPRLCVEGLWFCVGFVLSPSLLLLPCIPGVWRARWELRARSQQGHGVTGWMRGQEAGTRSTLEACCAHES